MRTTSSRETPSFKACGTWWTQDDPIHPSIPRITIHILVGRDFGEVHHVHQGEGGEQVDPLMPMLFNHGQHRALVAVQSKLNEDEKLFAFLDDVYVICRPTRVPVVGN